MTFSLLCFIALCIAFAALFADYCDVINPKLNNEPRLYLVLHQRNEEQQQWKIFVPDTTPSPLVPSV